MKHDPIRDGIRPITKAQRAALDYVVGMQGVEGTYRGGQLVGYYAEEARLRGRRRKHCSVDGWRRAGGRVLKSLERCGALSCSSWAYGVPIYRLTAKGASLLKEGR